MNTNKSEEPRPTLLHRIHSALWDETAEGESQLELLSTESLKTIFDVVKNFVLVAAVVGALLLLKNNKLGLPSELALGSYWMLLLFAAILVLLNMQLLSNWLVRLKLFRGRKYPFFLLVPIIGVLAIPAIILVLALASKAN